ncbi:MAG TPA: phosphate ABC transporter substrate-binding protein, partial [Anaeromyxobacteraceae bacterium]|nr:phosphate ABC transporter substrate-binding protein [Anaeromyxobacteraceae bacterium]
MVILVQRWAEGYMKKNPGRKVQVTGGGSGTGIAALVNGTTDVATASRSIKESESAKVRDRHGVRPAEIAVARDGVAFYVHRSNPVSRLTPAQLRAIYVGDVTNWKEVGGADAPVVVYSREGSSGTYVFVKEHVLGNADYTPRAQTLPGTAAVVNAVSKERNGIGYGGAAYGAGVKEVEVVGADGKAYLPTAENVQSGKYPLARPLFLYTRGEPAGEAKPFIDYCLSPEGQAVVTQVGYFPVR